VQAAGREQPAEREQQQA
jgi:hypothetical protein